MATRPICKIEGCGKPHYGNGWCSKHRDRWLRHGDPLGGRDADEPLRFFLDVVLPFKSKDCLIWPYSGNGVGYGKITYQGKRQYVHRAACEQVNGPPPTPDHEAAHSCGNGKQGCVNPLHLLWKTHAQNEADKLEHGTHQNGERNKQAKLTEDDVRAIRALQGVMPQSQIAEKFNIHQMQVSRIHRRERWGWLE